MKNKNVTLNTMWYFYSCLVWWLLAFSVFDVDVVFFTSYAFSPAAKYREEFKLIIDRIAVVKSENVSQIFSYF